jgi:hypothetical protein
MTSNGGNYAALKDDAVRGIPHFVIVSPEGTILESRAGYGEGLIERQPEKHI